MNHIEAIKQFRAAMSRELAQPCPAEVVINCYLDGIVTHAVLHSGEQFATMLADRAVEIEQIGPMHSAETVAELRALSKTLLTEMVL